jgi:hypothetical protein
MRVQRVRPRKVDKAQSSEAGTGTESTDTGGLACSVGVGMNTGKHKEASVEASVKAPAR